MQYTLEYLNKFSRISFPGLGIDEFEVCKEAFDIADVLGFFGVKIGGMPIYWYGIIITFGMVFAFLYTVFRGKYESVKSEDILDIALWAIIAGVVGARLYYVFNRIDYFIPEDGDPIGFIINVVNLRSGGLAVYGGIIGGAIAVIAVACIKKIKFLKILDMAAPGVMLAQAMGRWGNFFNGEAFGGIVEEGHPLYFMRMGLNSGTTVYTFKTYETVFVHPTFLYESLWNLAGFVLINIFYKKKKFNGQIVCSYLAWYGFGRFFVEGLRTDSLYIPGTELRISQVVGIACFVIFGAALTAGLIYSKKKLYAEGAELNGFDMFIKPDLIMNPVFFEKKAEKKCKNDDTVVNSAGSEEKDTEYEKTEETETEEEENGENN